MAKSVIYIHHNCNSQLTFIPIQIWMKAKNTKHENTWSEYYTQHSITDSLSFTAAISMAALWLMGVYKLGCPVTAVVLGTAITEMHCTILLKLAIQWNIKPRNQNTWELRTNKGQFTHSTPFPCHATKGLECVFPVWFTQCGRVWFTLAMPCCSSQGHSTAQPSLYGRAVLWPWEERHGRSMARQVWIRHGCTVYIKHIPNT